MSEEGRSLRSRVVRGAAAALGGNFVFTVSNAVLILLLTRELLDPTRFGRLYFAISVLGVVAIFADLGLRKSAAHYISEYDGRDPGQVRYVIRYSVTALVVLVATASVLTAVFSGPAARLLGEPAVAPLLALGSLYVVGHAFQGYLSTIFQAFNRVEWSATINGLTGVARLVLAVGFILLGLDVLGAMLGYVGGFAVAVLVGGVVLYRRHYAPLEPADSPEPGLGRRILRYSIPLTVTEGTNALDKRVDIILLGSLLNPAAAGYYVVAKQISSFSIMPATSIGYSVTPAYGGKMARESPEKSARLYEESLRYVLLVYLPAAAGLVLVAGPTVELVFGAAYTPAVPVVQVMSGYVLARAVNKVTSDGLDYLGLARERAVLKTVTTFANVLLNVLLIPIFGVVGAAVATTTTFATYTAGNVYQLHKELPVDNAALLREGVVISFVTAAMTVVVMLALPYVSGPVTLAGVVVLGGGVTGVLSVATGLVDMGRVRTVLGA